MTAVTKTKGAFLNTLPKGKNKAAMMARNPTRPLTQKQKDFAVHWAQGNSIHAAAARAGYEGSETVGYSLQHDPRVKELYYAEKARFEAASQMTRKKVLDGLLEGIEHAKLLGEPASIITGWKTIGQMCGYFEPVKKTIDINVNGSVQIKRLEAMSDADLLRLIKGEVEEVVFKDVEGDQEDAAD